MFTILNDQKENTYLECLQKLYGEGARNFLFVGKESAIQPISVAAKNKYGDLKVTCLFEERQTEPEHNPGKILGKGTANYNAIFFFSHQIIPSLIPSLCSMSEKTQVVFHKRRTEIVIGYSLPKCGTHLLQTLIGKLGFNTPDMRDPPTHRAVTRTFPELKKNTYYWTHLTKPGTEFFGGYVPPDLIKAWYKEADPLVSVVFNYRDPRDFICSYVRYLMPDADEVLRMDPLEAPYTVTAHNLLHSSILRGLPDQSARLMHVISDSTFPYRDCFHTSTWLLRHPKVCKVRFEDLVGPQGGGKAEAQKIQVAQLMYHLGVAGDPDEMTNDILGKSRTFSKGQIGNWKEEFEPKHIEAFKRINGDILKTYGYE